MSKRHFVIIFEEEYLKNIIPQKEILLCQFWEPVCMDLIDPLTSEVSTAHKWGTFTSRKVGPDTNTFPTTPAAFISFL